MLQHLVCSGTEWKMWLILPSSPLLNPNNCNENLYFEFSLRKGHRLKIWPVIYTNIQIVYKQWMFMSAMVQIFSWGERWNVPFNEAKPIEWNFIFHRMKIFVPLHEWKNIHYLFHITVKSFSAKLTMFSQNLLRCNRGKLWTHHAWLANSARVKPSEQFYHSLVWTQNRLFASPTELGLGFRVRVKVILGLGTGVSMMSDRQPYFRTTVPSD